MFFPSLALSTFLLVVAFVLQAFLADLHWFASRDDGEGATVDEEEEEKGVVVEEADSLCATPLF